MDAFLALIFFIDQSPGCEIPLTTWLSVYYILQCFEIMTEELRGRIHNSPYYDHYRLRRKVLQNGMVVFKELCEAAWVIYGITLYYSEGANGCSE